MAGSLNSTSDAWTRASSHTRIAVPALPGNAEVPDEWHASRSSPPFTPTSTTTSTHLVDRTTFKQRRSAALAEWQSLFS
jgi:hypothetical protein